MTDFKYYLKAIIKFRKYLIYFLLVLLLLSMTEFFLLDKLHETEYLFYGYFGFLSCLFIVAIAKLFSILLARPNDYYDE